MKVGALAILFFALSSVLFVPIVASSAAPSAPVDLVAFAGRDYVDLSWKAPASDGGSNLTTYALFRGENPEDMVLMANFTANVTAYHDENVETARTYFYQVAAWNEGNMSVRSDMVLATIPKVETTDNGTLVGVVALAIAAVAIQLGIVAIWVILKKGARKQ
ncbi:MAG: Fibronectin type III domain protein [Methanomassiliicoccales archaeon PtaU1.Bin124]|nr:MAG: Fibronectin type III domain protein [Methanomassiliicoccales archaeon PtaU1.Bin124]